MIQFSVNIQLHVTTDFDRKIQQNTKLLYFSPQFEKTSVLTFTNNSAINQNNNASRSGIV